MAADDTIDFRFLGQQVRNLQSEVRDLRSGHLRLESDVVGIRADVARLEHQVTQQITELSDKIDSHHRGNQAQFSQMAQTAATNLRIILAELADLKRKQP